MVNDTPCQPHPLQRNVTLGISTKMNTWTTYDSMVPHLAACTHVQSTALPLSTAEFTLVKVTERQKKLATRAAVSHPQRYRTLSLL
jgi:hypothetical protein